MSRRKDRFQPLKALTVADENFAHTVRLVGPGAAMIETLAEGQRVDFNARNCLHIVTEVALAFISERAEQDGPLGDAARDALKTLAMFRAANEGRLI